MKVTQNVSRLEYLLKSYSMTVDELLVLISEGLKKPLTKDAIWTTEIDTPLQSRRASLGVLKPRKGIRTEM